MIVLVTLLAVGATFTSTSAGPPKKLAIVIGNNHPLPDHDYETLRFADDDAIRFAELFSSAGIETTLFTTPDAETAARFPEWSKKALRPLRSELERVLAQLRLS